MCMGRNEQGRWAGASCMIWDTFAVASDIFKIVKMIMERALQPVIVFSFSKRECEAYALQVSKLDFNGDDEKEMVDKV